jgi:hypothetical protein
MASDFDIMVTVSFACTAVYVILGHLLSLLGRGAHYGFNGLAPPFAGQGLVGTFGLGLPRKSLCSGALYFHPSESFIFRKIFTTDFTDGETRRILSVPSALLS